MNLDLTNSRGLEDIEETRSLKGKEIDYDQTPRTPSNCDLEQPDLPSTDRIRYLIFFSFCSAMGMFLYGYSNTLFGDLYHYYIIQVFGFSEGSSEYDLYSSLFSFCHTGGAIFGSLFANCITNRIGHRKTFIITDVLCILTLVLYQLENLNLALVARAIIGFIVGINSAAVLSYISEVAPVEFMGRFSGFCAFFVNFGILVCAILGFGLGDDMGNWWRVMLGVPFITCFIRLIFFVFFHKFESPRFYFFKEQEEIAKKALHLVYLPHHCYYQICLLQKEKLRVVEELPEEVKDMKRRRLKIIAVIFALNQLVGINAIVFNSYDIFSPLSVNDAGETNDTLIALLILIFYILDTSCALNAAFFFDEFGRRPTVLTAIAITAISLLGIIGFITTEYTTMTAMFFYTYIVGFATGPGAGCYVTSADMVVKEHANVGIIHPLFTLLSLS